jgi:hypothetical protein
MSGVSPVGNISLGGRFLPAVLGNVGQSVCTFMLVVRPLVRQGETISRVEYMVSQQFVAGGN